MNEILKKISYLKGLCDGLELDKDSKEGKILTETIDSLDVLSNYVVEIDNKLETVIEFIDALDDDLKLMEDYVFELDNFDLLDNLRDFDEEFESDFEDFDFFGDDSDDEEFYIRDTLNEFGLINDCDCDCDFEDKDD